MDKKYKSLAIIGTQWGDEGKGKITDYFAQEADLVVRYQGGNNAGHTIKFNGNKYALHLLPSGIFNEKIQNVMTNGMVIDPIALVKELEQVENWGFKNYQLFISERAHVLLPYHVQLDGMFEDLKSPENKIGTTKKGIGPAYSDKSNRDGIRIIDLLDEQILISKLKDNLSIKNKIFKAFNLKEFTLEEILEPLKKAIKKIKPFVRNTSLLIENAFEANKKVLFEGAQGVLLCLDHGTYPFVTSSSPTASSIPYYSGINFKYLNNVLGVVKAYSTRVGAGALPTEIKTEIANQIREKGNEFGVTTGRARRIGWFDAVILKHSISSGSINKVVITLLDVLSGFDKIKIAYSYNLDGKEINYIPARNEDFERAIPNYIEVNGWKEDITNIKSFDELPLNAKNYLSKIEELIKVEIVGFSVGPDRLQTIFKKDIFNND